MKDLDWSQVRDDTRHQIVAEGHTYLDAQIRLATSADQRASALSSVFIAAGTALIAGLVAAGSITSLPRPVPFYAGGITSVAFFLFAGVKCITAALPVGVWLPGTQPKQWREDIRHNVPIGETLINASFNIQEKIDENRDIIRSNARKFRIGAYVGIASPLAGFAVWLMFTSASYYCR